MDSYAWLFMSKSSWLCLLFCLCIAAPAAAAAGWSLNEKCVMN